jgi:hypothetical protein
MFFSVPAENLNPATAICLECAHTYCSGAARNPHYDSEFFFDSKCNFGSSHLELLSPEVLSLCRKINYDISPYGRMKASLRVRPRAIFVMDLSIVRTRNLDQKSCRKTSRTFVVAVIFRSIFFLVRELQKLRGVCACDGP